jgi:hypothetical protein
MESGMNISEETVELFPMHLAPRDGTEVQAWEADGTSAYMYFQEFDWYYMDDLSDESIMAGMDINQRLEAKGFWYTEYDKLRDTEFGGNGDSYRSPVGWRPIPKSFVVISD